VTASQPDDDLAVLAYVAMRLKTLVRSAAIHSVISLMVFTSFNRMRLMAGLCVMRGWVSVNDVTTGISIELPLIYSSSLGNEAIAKTIPIPDISLLAGRVCG
jgi:hypothetical protein